MKAEEKKHLKIVYWNEDKEIILFYVQSGMESHVLLNYHDQLGHVWLDIMKEVILKNYCFPKVSPKSGKEERDSFTAFPRKTFHLM